MKRITLGGFALAALLAAGCNDGGSDTTAPMTQSDADDATAVAMKEEAAGHQHSAPHGGTLIEIGEHQYNLELVYPDGEMMTVYTLGPHAQTAVMMAASDIELEIDGEDGEETEVELTPVDPVDGRATKFTAPASAFGDAKSLDELDLHVHVTVDGEKLDGEMHHHGEDHDHGDHDHGDDDHDHGDGDMTDVEEVGVKN